MSERADETTGDKKKKSIKQTGWVRIGDEGHRDNKQDSTECVASAHNSIEADSDLQAGDGGGRRHQTLIQQRVEGGVARQVGGAPVHLHVFRQVLACVLQLVFIQNDIKHVLQVDDRQSGGGGSRCTWFQSRGKVNFCQF